MTVTLGDVQTTALIPVAIKANETLRKNPRIRDDYSVEIIRHLKIDTRPYDKFMSHEGVIARTVMLDRMMTDYIKKNPDLVVVNLGAGLDNRFARLDNGKISWFDIDLPDCIQLRKKIFPERERVFMIEGNILEDSWCKKVKNEIERKNTPVIFIAEGVFMYLSMDEIAKVLNILKSNFPQGILIAEQNNPLMVKNEKYHDTVKNTNAHFKSGTKSAEEICQLCPGITLVEERSFNEEMKKHSIRGKLFAALLPGMNDRWATFKW
ncbi:class I SAM-dependent methyltransferase [Treponema sp.]|uniref:class I SAM-dependent methyltransferase n=1 Tax=Treponema sp. TaxID=166 RepID=UPI0025FE8802|nr:class I SAM-dependent methyltransferase [Treponema sp.]MCR5218991.1 class I SAM-dependent methyltransferase [Treponema sp.]